MSTRGLEYGDMEPSAKANTASQATSSPRQASLSGRGHRVGAGDLDELVVKAPDQEGRRPLAHKQAGVFPARELETERAHYGTAGGPEEQVRGQLGSLLLNCLRYRPLGM